MKCTPKTKQIFKVDKFARSTSSCSENCPSKHLKKEDPDSQMSSEDKLVGYEEFINNPATNLFGPQTSTMNLSAGVQQDLFGDGLRTAVMGIEQPIMNMSNLGPLDPSQMNRHNLLLQNKQSGIQANHQ
jgi:hypothetical protein